ncbi:MAG: hypothetical protein SCK28_11630 [Bacillota bacterium]|nr:hypothetical protein [Bacillota bacterium]
MLISADIKETFKDIFALEKVLTQVQVEEKKCDLYAQMCTTDEAKKLFEREAMLIKKSKEQVETQLKAMERRISK